MKKIYKPVICGNCKAKDSAIKKEKRSHNETKNRELDINEKYVILKAKYNNLQSLIKKIKEETNKLQTLAASESERIENAVKALRGLLNGN